MRWRTVERRRLSTVGLAGNAYPVAEVSEDHHRHGPVRERPLRLGDLYAIAQVQERDVGVAAVAVVTRPGPKDVVEARHVSRRLALNLHRHIISRIRGPEVVAVPIVHTANDRRSPIDVEYLGVIP